MNVPPERRLDDMNRVLEFIAREVYEIAPEVGELEDLQARQAKEHAA